MVTSTSSVNIAQLLQKTDYKPRGYWLKLGNNFLVKLCLNTHDKRNYSNVYGLYLTYRFTRFFCEYTVGFFRKALQGIEVQPLLDGCELPATSL